MTTKPKRIDTYTFSIEGTLNGERVRGVFTAKRLSYADLMRKDVRAAELCGGMHAVIDEGGETGRGVPFTAWLLAQRRAHMELAFANGGQAPDWFDMDEVYDDPRDAESIVHKVWQEVARGEASFRATGRAPVAGAGAGGAGSQLDPASGAGDGAAGRQGSNAGSGAALVVGREVRAPI